MQTLQTVNKISFKNILFLTDFSEASNTATAKLPGAACTAAQAFSVLLTATTT